MVAISTVTGCVRLINFSIDSESKKNVVIRNNDEYGKYSLLTVNKNTLIIKDERGIHIRYNRYTENKWFFGECIKEN